MTATTVATIGLLAAGLATFAGLSQVGSGAAPTTTVSSTSADAATTTGGLTTTPLVSVSTPQPESTTNDGFDTGAAASAAAEDLLVGYVTSQHEYQVTDPACSEPASGAVGERFVCYALKSRQLVIAFRATIRERRLITLDLLIDQVPTTTTTTVAVEPTDTTETPETTES